jgi:hypothetical protein
MTEICIGKASPDVCTIFPSLNTEDVNRLNEHINYITKDEISTCIKKLKNNKAFGEDLVLNEYIKNTEFYYSDTYETLFNVVFNSGIIPESWLIGNIKPIYKNKGDKMNPKNFRPITILSCLSKLFTASPQRKAHKVLRCVFIIQREPTKRTFCNRQFIHYSFTL